MKNTTADEIIKRIKEKRIEKELSYQQLADITKMSKSTLQRYETGEIENIPLHRLEVLANALGCTPAYLMGWEDEYGNTNIEAIDKMVQETMDAVTPVEHIQGLGQKERELIRLFRFLNHESKKIMLEHAKFLCSDKENCNAMRAQSIE